MDLNDLHKAVSEGLLDRIKAEDAAPGDFANAIRFLKDNGVTSIPEFDNELTELIEGIELSDAAFQPEIVGGTDV